MNDQKSKEVVFGITSNHGDIDGNIKGSVRDVVEVLYTVMLDNEDVAKMMLLAVEAYNYQLKKQP